MSKIFKTGLGIDFRVLEIYSFEQVDLVYVSAYKHCVQYKAVSYVVGEYACSVVLPKHTDPILQSFWNCLRNIANEC